MPKPRNSSIDADVINYSNLDVQPGVRKVFKTKTFSLKVVAQNCSTDPK